MWTCLPLLTPAIREVLGHRAGMEVILPHALWGTHYGADHVIPGAGRERWEGRHCLHYWVLYILYGVLCTVVTIHYSTSGTVCGVGGYSMSGCSQGSDGSQQP